MLYYTSVKVFIRYLKEHVCEIRFDVFMPIVRQLNILLRILVFATKKKGNFTLRM